MLTNIGSSFFKVSVIAAAMETTIAVKMDQVASAPQVGVVGQAEATAAPLLSVGADFSHNVCIAARDGNLTVLRQL